MDIINFCLILFSNMTEDPDLNTRIVYKVYSITVYTIYI